MEKINLLKILVGNREHVAACLEIGRSLPEYFDTNGLKEMERSLLEDTLYVAEEREEVAGFLTVREKGKVVEIAWLAVNPAWQGEGVGRSLVRQVEKDFTVRGARMLVVKTLAETADYSPFEATRLFYEKAGFLRVEIVDPYPGWNGDPAAIYAKAL